MVRYPPLVLSFTQTHLCDTPFCNVSRDTCAILGPAFGRMDCSRIFIFEPPDFFADFLAGFFLLIFVGKSAQKNPPGKSPGKSSKIYTTKILQHISADCPGQAIPHQKKTRISKSFAILSLRVSRDMKSIAAGPRRPEDPPGSPI